MPHPDQRPAITLERETTRVRALFEGHEIADSADVVVLHEPGRPAVRYFPRTDVSMIFLRRTETLSGAAPKGDAVLFTIYRDAKLVERAAWSHERPDPSLAGITGRIAFHDRDVEFQVAGRTAAQTDVVDDETGPRRQASDRG